MPPKKAAAAAKTTKVAEKTTKAAEKVEKVEPTVEKAAPKKATTTKSTTPTVEPTPKTTKKATKMSDDVEEETEKVAKKAPAAKKTTTTAPKTTKTPKSTKTTKKQPVVKAAPVKQSKKVAKNVEQPTGAFEASAKDSTINNALSALRTYLKNEQDKSMLGGVDHYIELQIDFLSPAKSKSQHSITLPHSIYHRKGVSICLLTKDDQGDWEDRLEAANIDNVTRVVSVSKLGSDFKPFEHRRLLRNQHDLFLCDEAIKPMLPTLLGRDFISGYKSPIGLNFATQFARQTTQARDSTHFMIPNGTTFTIRVGHSTQKDAEVVENLKNVLKSVEPILPRRIKSLHLRTHESPSLPLFLSLETEVSSQKDKTTKLNPIQQALAKKAHHYGLTVLEFEEAKEVAKKTGLTFPQYAAQCKKLGLKVGSNKIPVDKNKVQKKLALKLKNSEKAARRNINKLEKKLVKVSKIKAQAKKGRKGFEEKKAAELKAAELKAKTAAAKTAVLASKKSTDKVEKVVEEKKGDKKNTPAEKKITEKKAPVEKMVEKVVEKPASTKRKAAPTADIEVEDVKKTTKKSKTTKA